MTNKDFEEIYKEYRDYAIRIASLILQNKSEVEDICQDVFEAIYEMGEGVEFLNKAKLCGLIKTMTFNKTLDYYKKGYRKYEYASSDTLEAITESEDAIRGNAEDWILALEANIFMTCIFQKLREKNPVNYEIYINVKFSDVPPRTVAKRFHMSENSVNNRVLRTKRWLMKEYKKMLHQKE